MWRHEGKKKTASIAFPPPGLLGATQEMPCTMLPLGDEYDEESLGWGIKDGSTKNVNGGWRSPGPGPD